jgi:purine-nucleoside/S-methyl-5'-thioadenosine phosphorylase / adenosine deaminase
VPANGWTEEELDGLTAHRPPRVPRAFLVAFSSRGVAPPATPSPTEYLSRRFADALSLTKIPIVRATQVHGNTAIRVREAPAAGAARDAGKSDILATQLPGVALVVQTADCVPIVLAGANSIAVVHAGWRGSAKNAAAAGVAALADFGEDPRSLLAFLGPSIRACCYEVGGEVAAQFAGEFSRRSCDGRFRLDLQAVNRSQLEAAGVPAGNITAHPACTMCGGERFASYRRDGSASGRMIALAVRGL